VLMRIVLADIRGTAGFVSKDTVAGGFGSRLRPFYLRINRPAVRSVVSALDTRVERRHARREQARMGAAAC